MGGWVGGGFITYKYARLLRTLYLHFLGILIGRDGLDSPAGLTCEPVLIQPKAILYA